VTQNVELIERVEQLSRNLIRDYLTGLYNRRYLFEAGSKLLAHCERNNLNCAIAMIDLDRFKTINDSHGHLTGDEVLRRIGLVLQSRLRDSDIVARLGGEEFCVLATDIRPEKCEKMFQDLLNAIAAEIFDCEGQPLQVTASIGVCPTRAGTLDEMIRKADTMLYQAKEQGRNRVACSCT
jgi:diguanylate cyclase (GGDEF)-like protein